MPGHSEVVVWRIALQQPPERIEQLRATLSPDELVRADRFYFEQHRQRFIVARGALRSILAGPLQVPPADVAFVYNGYGKPAVAPQMNGVGLQFNLSHSADLALCACTREREVGIDVEAVRGLANADALAARYFDAPEYATYLSLPAEGRLDGFFVRWTLKEAYIKALGRGLSIPLSEFTIQSTPNASGRHVVYSKYPAEDSRWSAIRLSTHHGYIAAMVVEGGDARVEQREWAP